LLEEAKTQSSRIMKVNVDENRDLASKMGIRSIPTTVIFQNGSAVDKKVGAMTSVKEICSLLV
jgi:thioredoxin 1